MHTKEEAMEILTEFEKFCDMLKGAANYSESERYSYDHAHTQDSINLKILEEKIIHKELDYIDSHFYSDEANIFKSIISLGAINEHSEEYKQGLLAIYSQIYQNFGFQVVSQFKDNILLNVCNEDSEENKALIDKIFNEYSEELTHKTSLKLRI